MNLFVKFDETKRSGQYFLACARIRNISATALGKRLILKIIRDQLIAQVLEDESNLRARKPGEHVYGGPK